MGIDLSQLPRWLIYPFLILLIAFIAHRLAWHIAGLLLRPVIRPSSSRSRFFGRFRRLNSEVDAAHERRRKTLQQLIASLISVAAFITAIVFSLSHVVGWDTLLWIGGFLTAAFGFGARALISDLLAGFNIIFEDIFDVGEKIEIGSLGITATGVVEHVSLRTTWVRAPSGELYVVPNGDIRILRNFSRGRFSMTNITLKIGAADLPQALPLLADLGKEAVVLLPNLLEPWQVISKTGTIGGYAELTLVAKARFGQAADMRPHLLALVQERLTEAGIELVG
jgi:small conductance mechanosensitive channel